MVVTGVNKHRGKTHTRRIKSEILGPKVPQGMNNVIKMTIVEQSLWSNYEFQRFQLRLESSEIGIAFCYQQL